MKQMRSRKLVSYNTDDLALFSRVLEIWDPKDVSRTLNSVSPGAWTAQAVRAVRKGRAIQHLVDAERLALESLLPTPRNVRSSFDFIDLFAGIGGLRQAFEGIGGRCVLTSEWNRFAVRTYKANYASDPAHVFNDDIRKLTLTDQSAVNEAQAYEHIRANVPDHDVLLAGFPCQPFSIAGVSKKNSLGRAHGFECKAQGTLFFDVARILAAKRPAAFLLENVKNLKGHDGGRTFQIIEETLDELGYWVSDSVHVAGHDPRIVDAQHFVPQHRERIVLVGFRKDLDVHQGFSLREIVKSFPAKPPRLGEILETEVEPSYILSEKLWKYLFDYAAKHKAKGNGFGFGLVNGDSVTRTLSHRYHKDGSEILIDRGFNPAKPVDHPYNMARRPRRLTPRECARLMGYDKPRESRFVIPVSDTQAYQQFGNSVVVPLFEAVAQLMRPRIVKARKRIMAMGEGAAQPSCTPVPPRASKASGTRRR